jgi:hypothetical protein
MSLINSASGKVRFSVPLVTAPGVPGRAIRASLRYDSGIREEVTTWNAEMPTGSVGLGWTFSWPQIVRQPRLSGSPTEDGYVLVGDGDQQLTLRLSAVHPDGSLEFQTSTFVKVTYAPATERWTVTETDGTVLTFGGSDNATSFGVSWGGSWLGPSLQTKNQRRYATRWHLARVTNLHGQSLHYAYTADLADEWQIGTGGLVFTRDKRLLSITADAGYQAVFHYGLKDADENLPDRVATPGTPTERAVSAYQDLSARHYLSSVDVLNPDGVRVRSTLLGYYADPLNAEHPTMVKRLLRSVTRVNEQGTPLAPPTVYDYYGRSGQRTDGFAFDVSPATAVAFSNGGLYGALRTVTTPEGATQHVVYGQVEVGRRDVQVVVPVGYHAPRLRFGSDYVLFSYEKDNSRDLRVDVWQWVHGTWQLVHTVSDILPAQGNRANLLIEVEADFFALGCPGAATVPVVHYKDPHQVGVWRTTGTQPPALTHQGEHNYRIKAGSSSSLVALLVQDGSSWVSNPSATVYLWNGTQVPTGGSWTHEAATLTVGKSDGDVTSFALSVSENTVIAMCATTDTERTGFVTRWTTAPFGRWHRSDGSVNGFFNGTINALSPGANFAAAYSDPVSSGEPRDLTYTWTLCLFDWSHGELTASSYAYSAKTKDLPASAGLYLGMPDAVTRNSPHEKLVYRHDGAEWTTVGFTNAKDPRYSLLAPTGPGITVAVADEQDNLLPTSLWSFGPNAPAPYSQQVDVQLPDTGESGLVWFAEEIIDLLLQVAAMVVTTPLGALGPLANILVNFVDSAVLEPVIDRALRKPQYLQLGGVSHLATAVVDDGHWTNLYYRNPYATRDLDAWLPVDTSGLDVRTLVGKPSFSQFTLAPAQATFTSNAAGYPTSSVWLLKNGCVTTASDAQPSHSAVLPHRSAKPPKASPQLYAPGIVALFTPGADHGNGDDATEFTLLRHIGDGVVGPVMDDVAVSVRMDDGFQTAYDHVDYSGSVDDLLGWPDGQRPIYGLTRAASGAATFHDAKDTFGWSEDRRFTGRAAAPDAPASNVGEGARLVAGRPYLGRLYDASGALQQEGRSTWNVFALGDPADQPVMPWVEVVTVDTMADGTHQVVSYDYEATTCGAVRSSTVYGSPVPGLNGPPETVTETSVFGWERYPELASRHVLTPVVQQTTTHRHARTRTPAAAVAWSFALGDMRVAEHVNLALYTCEGGVDCIAPGAANRAYVPGRPLTAESFRLARCDLYRDGTVQRAVTADEFGGVVVPADAVGQLVVDPLTTTAYFSTATGGVGVLASQHVERPDAFLSLSTGPLHRETSVFRQLPPSTDPGLYAADTSTIYAVNLLSAGRQVRLQLAAEMTVRDTDGTDCVLTSGPVTGTLNQRVYLSAARAAGTRGVIAVAEPLGLRVTALVDVGGLVRGAPAVVVDQQRQLDVAFVYVAPSDRPSAVELVAVSFTQDGPFKAKVVARSDAFTAGVVGDPLPLPDGSGAYVLGADNTVRLLTLSHDDGSLTPAWAAPFEVPGAVARPASVDGQGNVAVAYTDAAGDGAVTVVSPLEGSALFGTFIDMAFASVQAPPQPNPLNGQLVVLGQQRDGTLSLVGVTSGALGEASSVDVATWDPATMLPDATFTWRGTGSPDFWAPGRNASNWHQNGALVRSRDGIPLEATDAEGVVATTSYDPTLRLPLASFDNASAHTGEAFFTSFEVYEDLSRWPLGRGCAVDSSDSFTGRRCLKVEPDSTIAVPLGDVPLVRSLGDVLVGLWAKTGEGYSADAPLTIGLTLDGVGVGDVHAVPATALAWQPLVLDVDLSGHAAAGQSLGLLLTNQSATDVWLDHVWVTPLTSSFAASVYDPVLRVVTEAIDRNGSVSRVVYDPLLRSYGAVGPDQLADGAAALLYSRDASAGGVFTASQPNSTLALTARSGGEHFRFRTPRDADGWTVEPASGGTLGDGAIRLAAGATARFDAVPDHVHGIAVRTWVEAASAGATVSVTCAGVGVTFAAEAGGRYDLSLEGQHVTTVDAPFGRDWLLVVNRSTAAPESTSITLCVDGRVLHDAVQPGVSASRGVALAGDAVAFSRVFVFYDPVLTIAYADGAGRLRQHQARESVSTVLMSEQLYDLVGRPSVETVAVRKMQGASNVSGFGFEPGFVADRDPAAPGALWRDAEPAGPMHGLVRDWWTYPDWDNPEVRAEDRDYPYSGAAYGRNLLSRPAQAVSSASEYREGAPHATRYDYGIGQVPAAAAMMDKMSVAAQDRDLYTVSDATHALSDTDEVRVVSVADGFGRALVSGLWHGAASTDQVLTGARYGFGADGGVEATTLLPNAFLGQAGFAVEVRSNALGDVVETTTPDAGTSTTVHDLAGRPRFSQDARGAEEGYFASCSYDPLGRPTQVAIVEGLPWDAAWLRAAGQVPQWRLRENLSGDWTLDESTGSTAHDSSGFGRDGTVQKGGAWVPDAPNGYGHSLELSRDAASYVAIPGSQALVGDQLRAYTFAAWVKMTELPTPSVRNEIVRAKDEAGTRSLYLHLASFNGNRLMFGVQDYTGGTHVASTQLFEPTQLGTWVHVVGVYDGTALQIFTNAVAGERVPFDSTGLPPQTSWTLGAEVRAGKATGFLPGRLSGVRVYARALTSAEVRLLYVDGLGQVRHTLRYDDPSAGLFPLGRLAETRVWTDDSTSGGPGTLVVERMTYDASGRTLSHGLTVPAFDDVERVTRYEYDNLGNVVRITAPLQ